MGEGDLNIQGGFQSQVSSLNNQTDLNQNKTEQLLEGHAFGHEFTLKDEPPLEKALDTLNDLPVHSEKDLSKDNQITEIIHEDKPFEKTAQHVTETFKENLPTQTEIPHEETTENVDIPHYHITENLELPPGHKAKSSANQAEIPHEETTENVDIPHYHITENLELPSRAKSTPSKNMDATETPKQEVNSSTLTNTGVNEAPKLRPLPKTPAPAGSATETPKQEINSPTLNENVVIPEHTTENVEIPHYKISENVPHPKIGKSFEQIGNKIAALKGSKENISNQIEKLAQECTELAPHTAGSPALKLKLASFQKSLQELAQGDKPLQNKLEVQFKAASNLVKWMDKTGEKMKPGETISSLLANANVSEKDIENESKLFSQDKTVAQLKLAKRAIILKKSGIDTSKHSPSLAKLGEQMDMQPSVVKAAFSIYKAQNFGTGKEQPNSLDGHNFHVVDKKVVIEQEIGLAAGSFKLTRTAQVLFQDGKLVTQRPHTPGELKAFKASKGEEDIGASDVDELKEAKEKHKDNWAEDANQAKQMLEGGSPGDFKIYVGGRTGSPTIIFLDIEGNPSSSKPLTFDEILTDEFSGKKFVDKELNVQEEKKLKAAEDKSKAEAKREVVSEKPDPEDIENKFNELIKDKEIDVDYLDSSAIDNEELYASYAAIEQRLKDEGMPYLISYTPYSMDGDEVLQIDLYRLDANGKFEKMAIFGSDALKDGFSIEKYLDELSGQKTESAFSNTSVRKADVPEISYNIDEMTELLIDMRKPIGTFFNISDENLKNANLSIEMLVALKSDPRANDEIRVVIDNVIDLRERLDSREKFQGRVIAMLQKNTHEDQVRMEEFKLKAEQQGEKFDENKFNKFNQELSLKIEYENEVDLSFELSKLGEGIEDIHHFTSIGKDGTVSKSMLKTIADRELPGDCFIDNKPRVIRDMEQFMTASKNGKLSDKGKKELFRTFGGALEGSVKMANAKWIHRDLKPENILIPGVLTDFGTTLKEGDPKLSEFGGTPFYTPPEGMTVRSGDTAYAETLTSKYDVWSWGMMFHEMESDVEDHPIFTGVNNFEDVEVICTHVDKAFRSKEFQEKYENEYHKEPADKNSLAHLSWECTQIDPNKRPSMSEVLEKYNKIISS